MFFRFDMASRPQLRFIAACLFLDALGVGLIIPVLPRLIGELTLDPQSQTLWYGSIMLAYGLMFFISAPVLGALSDHFGRRPLLLGGMFGLGVTFVVPALSASLPLILASRIVGGLTSANMTVAQAYVADLSSPEDRANAFGKVAAAFSFGLILGPAVGGILGQSDPRIPFFAASCIALLNMAYGFFILPESLPRHNRRRPNWSRCNPFAGIATLTRRSTLRPLLTVLACASLGSGMLNCTWALYTEFRYGFTPLHIGLSVFLLGACLSFVQGFVLPRAAARFEHDVALRAVVIVTGLSLCGIALAAQGWISVVLCCLYALSGAVAPLISSAISAQTPGHLQGETMGSINAVISLFTALAPLLATPLLSVAQEQPYAVSAGLPYFAAALLFGLCLIPLRSPVSKQNS